MGKNTNIIEINGKQYDADTGAVVSHHTSHSKGQHLDGIVKGNRKLVDHAPLHHTPVTATHQPKPAASVMKAAKPSMRDVATRQPAKNVRHHAPEPAKTLMRHVVHKPAKAAVPTHPLRAQSQADLPISQIAASLMPKPSIAAIDTRRLRHAKTTPKSRLVSRFNLEASPTARPTSAIPATSSQAGISRPIVTNPVKARGHATAQSRTTSELLQRAIQQANSHEQSPLKHRRSSVRRTERIVGVSTLALMFVLLIGFAIHQNMPNIKLDVASSKAGFTASLPANQPAGYSLQNLSSDAGTVALHFHSNSDDIRNYTIIEKPSNWDSATLRDVFVVGTAGQDYQAVQTGGRTLYLYGHQNVTWVNGGIWYQVQSAGALSNQQLVNIATSL